MNFVFFVMEPAAGAAAPGAAKVDEAPNEGAVVLFRATRSVMSATVRTLEGCSALDRFSAHLAPAVEPNNPPPGPGAGVPAGFAPNSPPVVPAPAVVEPKSPPPVPAAGAVAVVEPKREGADVGGAVVEVEAAGAPKEKVGLAAAAGAALAPPKSPPPAGGAPGVDVAGAPNSDVVVPAGLAPKSPPPAADIAGAVELPNREGAAVPGAG